MVVIMSREINHCSSMKSYMEIESPLHKVMTRFVTDVVMSVMIDKTALSIPFTFCDWIWCRCNLLENPIKSQDPISLLNGVFQLDFAPFQIISVLLFLSWSACHCSNSCLISCISVYCYTCFVFTAGVHIRGAIKKFSAFPSSVENKIKIVFATYSSKA